MKTAVYIEDGFAQIVLTPENSFESKLLESSEKMEAKVHQGQFYKCNGGWNINEMQGQVWDKIHGGEDRSLIVCLTKPIPKPTYTPQIP